MADSSPMKHQLLDDTVCSKQAKQCLYIFEDPVKYLVWASKLNFTCRSLISQISLTRDASLGHSIGRARIGQLASREPDNDPYQSNTAALSNNRAGWLC